jgi:phage terminase small subunit
MLTSKQQRFCAEYLIDLNATQAAIRAGYSARTANPQGPRLLGNPEIQAAIAAAMAERCEQTKIDATWLLKRLVAEAEADLADLYDEENRLKPVHEWPPIWRQGLVAGVEVEELFEGRGDDREQIGVVKKVRLSDRVKRIELIGKHIDVSAFQENVNLTGVDDLAGRLARASQRLAEFDTPDVLDIDAAEVEADEDAETATPTPRPPAPAGPAAPVTAAPAVQPPPEPPPEPPPAPPYRPMLPASGPADWRPSWGDAPGVVTQADFDPTDDL